MRYTPKQMDNIKLLALQCFKRDEATIYLNLVKECMFTASHAKIVIDSLQQFKRTQQRKKEKR